MCKNRLHRTTILNRLFYNYLRIVTFLRRFNNRRSISDVILRHIFLRRLKTVLEGPNRPT